MYKTLGLRICTKSTSLRISFLQPTVTAIRAFPSRQPWGRPTTFAPRKDLLKSCLTAFGCLLKPRKVTWPTVAHSKKNWTESFIYLLLRNRNSAGRPFTLVWSGSLAYGLINVDLSSVLRPNTGPASGGHVNYPTTLHVNPILRLIWLIWEAIRTLLRALRLFLTFFPLLCLYPVTCLHHKVRVAWWTLVLWTIEASGPVFIKLGQWSSTRRDLFSVEFCQQFSRLQKHVHPHSWRFTARQLEEAFGPQWGRFLVNFDRQPIGSGCVAQVYHAYLRVDMLDGARDLVAMEVRQPTTYGSIKNRILEVLGLQPDSNESPSDIASKKLSHLKATADLVKERSHEGLLPVAVKVLHPGIHEAFRRDLFIMTVAARIVETVVPGVHWLNLSKCVEEFSGVMQRQIDLSYEANNLERFAYNFRNVTTIVFPKPLRPFVTENVLVETFEEGEQMLLYTSNGNHSASLKKKLADIGVDAVIKMIFEDNFVHGDLHPGNILVQNASEEVAATPPKMRALDILDTIILSVKKPQTPPLRLVFLDCGITATMGPRDLNNFLSVFTAITFGNGEEVGELFLKHTTEKKCIDEAGFRKDMAKIVDSFNSAQHFKDMDVSTVINNLFATLINHRVKLESNFASVILAMMVVEGLGHTLNPDLNLMDKARPVLLAKFKRTFSRS